MLLGHTYLLFFQENRIPDYMSFPVLSFPYDCATSTDLTVRYQPVTVCDIIRSRCAICSDLCSSRKRLFSCCKRTSSAAFGATFGPRRVPDNPVRLPRSRCSRHLLTNDEYSPSRRNNAPASPLPLHSSTSC